MLRVRNLSKKIGGLQVIDNMTFSAVKGEIFGILGPNDSGKTIAMKMITGLITPTSGVIEIGDTDIAQSPMLAKKLIGYLPDGMPFYKEMTVINFLQFIAEIRGIRQQDKYKRLAEVVKQTQLEDVLEHRISTLARSFQCKLAIAQALVHDPEILILDEPTNGLDPNQEHGVRKLIKDLAKDKCVILATRTISDIEYICDRVAIIANGKIVVESTPEELAHQSPFHNTLQLRVTKSVKSENIVDVIRTIAEITRVERIDSKRDEINLRIYPRSKFIPLSTINQLAEDLDWEILDLQVIAGRLEEVFRTITTRYQPVI